MRRVDILEVGGDGGIFQHAFALTQALDGATPVRLHTARGHEELGPADVCECFSWERDARVLRGPRVALRYLVRTLPHFVRTADLAWVQGHFKLPLTVVTLLALRLAGKRVIFSPHNVFPRDGGRLQAFLLRAAMRIADVVVVYNAADAASVRARNVRQLPLIFPVPEITPEAERDWAWVAEEGYAVAALGHIRADKNIPLLVEAAGRAGLKLIVMGPDKGALADVERAAAVSPVEVAIHSGYFDFAELGVVARDVGVVALPYQVASQSAVAELALSMGATVVAADTGGLAERADVVVPTLEVADWAAALRAAHEARAGTSLTQEDHAAPVIALVAELSR